MTLFDQCMPTVRRAPSQLRPELAPAVSCSLRVVSLSGYTTVLLCYGTFHRGSGPGHRKVTNPAAESSQFRLPGCSRRCVSDESKNAASSPLENARPGGSFPVPLSGCPGRAGKVFPAHAGCREAGKRSGRRPSRPRTSDSFCSPARWQDVAEPSLNCPEPVRPAPVPARKTN